MTFAHSIFQNIFEKVDNYLTATRPVNPDENIIYIVSSYSIVYLFLIEH